MTIEHVTRRNFLQIATPASIGLTAFISTGCKSLTKTSLNSESLIAPSTIAAKSNHTFNILQVTDIHFFAIVRRKINTRSAISRTSSNIGVRIC